MKPIPRLVFQVWVGDVKNIPEYYPVSRKSIETHMVSRGWQYVFLKNEEIEEFIKREYPEKLEMYLGFEHDIQRADAARPLLLKKYGGVYMDMHFELLDSIDGLFAEDRDVYLLPSPTFPSVFTNAFMASVPGADLWDRYLEEMQSELPWYAIGKHMEVMNSTGPLALNRSLKNTTSTIGTLDNKLVAPCSVCDIDDCDGRVSGSLVRQMRGGTWHSWDSKMYDLFICNWKKMSIVLVVIVVLFFYVG